MSRTRLRLLLLSAVVPLSVFSARAIHAQGTITGKITNEANAPLGDTRVLVIGTSIAVTTGEDGKFTVHGVPTGSVDLQALRVGYQSQKKTITVAPGTSATADFVMKQAVVQLDEIVTTATGQQRKIELGNSIQTLVPSSEQVNPLFTSCLDRKA